MRIRPFFLASWLSVSALALTSACSGSNNSGSSGSGSGDCNSVATAECNKLEQCAPVLIKQGYGDVKTCIARTTLDCKTFTAWPGASWSSAQFAACSSAVSQADCQALLSGNFNPAACPSTGSLANGKACGLDSQCQGGYCNTGTKLCGTCAGGNAKAGSPCTAAVDCASNLVCIKGSCAQHVAAGGSCSSTVDCASGLACVSGKCGAPVALGQPCTAGECALNAYCDPQKVCATIPLAAAGQPCDLVNGKVVQCSGGAYCNLDKQGQSGTCMAPLADGASCDPNVPDCLEPAQCINGKCALPDPSSCK